MAGIFAKESSGFRVFARGYMRRRYCILFYVLLLALVTAPLCAALDLGTAIIDVFLALSLFAAIIPADSTTSRYALLTVAVVVSLGRPVAAWLEHARLSALTLGFWTLVGLFAAASALRFAMRAKRVDAEHLYAALSAYLLAGNFFGLFYWVLEEITPGTFAAVSPFTRVGALYFSFVTLATLGYGDIVPRTDIARGLAIIEGVGGQLFLAVMVARLVSLYGRGDQSVKS